MSTIIRSALVVLALLGSVSAASATGYGHGYGQGGWTKSSGAKWHNNTRGFFDQLRKNGN